MMIPKNLNLAIAGTMASTGGGPYRIFPENHYHSDNWTNTADKHWWNKKTPPEYALSEIQVAIINNIRAQNNEKVIPIQNKLAQLRIEFDGLEMYMKVNLKKLRLNKVKIWKLEDEILDVNRETELQIRKILNRKQLEFFDADGYGWWNLVDNCWPSANDKLTNGEQRMMMSDRGFCW